MQSPRPADEEPLQQSAGWCNVSGMWLRNTNAWGAIRPRLLDTDWGAALAEELGRRIEARLLAEIPKIVATTVAELLGDPETLKRHRRR